MTAKEGRVGGRGIEQKGKRTHGHGQQGGKIKKKLLGGKGKR